MLGIEAAGAERAPCANFTIYWAVMRIASLYFVIMWALFASERFIFPSEASTLLVASVARVIAFRPLAPGGHNAILGAFLCVACLRFV